MTAKENSGRPNIMIRLLKVVVPLQIRVLLRRAHQYFVWRRAIREFRNEYASGLNPYLVDDLVYGWGNMGWSAFHDYSIGIIEAAVRNSGNVLECGSGLSTILLGIIARDRGFKVYSLEHDEKWRMRVQKMLDRLEIRSVQLFLSPIMNYGEFDWYSVTQLDLPDTFTLVICDGPPHYTKGGRYGLLPLMRKRLNDSSIILLDDFSRPREQEIVAMWREEFGLDFSVIGDHDTYAQISNIGRRVKA